MPPHMIGGCRTLLLVDLEVDKCIDRNDDHVREDVSSTDKQQCLRIIKWNPLRHLHHPKDDHQVGAIRKVSGMSGVGSQQRRGRTFED